VTDCGKNGALTEVLIRNSLLGVSSVSNSMSGLGRLRRAAVLIPIFFQGEQWRLLYTRRADTLQEHTGQVSFPGGGVETQDKNLEDTALREACEEIGIKPKDVTLLGRLADRSTISEYIISPVVGRICWPYPLRLEPSEVSRVFSIPLVWLADPTNYETRPYSSNGKKYQEVVYYQLYEGELLWGITAQITLDLLKTLKLA